MSKLFVIAYFAFGLNLANNGQEITRDHLQVSENMCNWYIQETFRDRNRDKLINLNWIARCVEAK